VKPPLKVDQHIPRPLDREAAAARVLELLPAELADAVWDEIIGPLYDSRTLRLRWRDGRCIRCSTVHPENWPNTLGGRRGKPWPGHLMSCPAYVGPLQHRVVNGHQVLMGWHHDCECGKSYPDEAWADQPVRCPDAALDWRGPRPESETP
jgi:hypothetical protein